MLRLGLGLGSKLRQGLGSRLNYDQGKCGDRCHDGVRLLGAAPVSEGLCMGVLLVQLSGGVHCDATTLVTGTRLTDLSSMLRRGHHVENRQMYGAGDLCPLHGNRDARRPAFPSTCLTSAHVTCQRGVLTVSEVRPALKRTGCAALAPGASHPCASASGKRLQNASTRDSLPG